MKRRYIAFLLGTALCFSMFHGCGKMEKGIKEKHAISEQEKIEDIVYGEVSQLTENTITIQVGTRKKLKDPKQEVSEQGDGKQDEDGQQKETEDAKENGTTGQVLEMPSILELTGEEQQIQITQDTTYKLQAMRGGQPMTEDRDLPKRQDGEAPGNEAMPGQDGKVPGNGAMPGQDGEAPGNEAMPGQDGKAPGNGAMPGQDGEVPGNGEFPTQDETAESENISFSDLSQGDTIKVVLAKDGSAAEITVMSRQKESGQSVVYQPENNTTRNIGNQSQI